MAGGEPRQLFSSMENDTQRHAPPDRVSFCSSLITKGEKSQFWLIHTIVAKPHKLSHYAQRRPERHGHRMDDGSPSQLSSHLQMIKILTGRGTLDETEKKNATRKKHFRSSRRLDDLVPSQWARPLREIRPAFFHACFP